MIELGYQDDQTGFDARVRGSDNRFNASSRSDSRGYYNSRDKGQAYSFVFDFQDAANTEYGAYWQNNHPDGLQLVISAIGFNAAQTARIKIDYVTGTAAGGAVVTPLNENRSSPNTAAGSGVTTAMEGGSAVTGITGLTSIGTADFAGVLAGGHEEFRLDDRIRLGVGDAIALQYFEGASGGDFWGVIFGYYEKKGKA